MVKGVSVIMILKVCLFVHQHSIYLLELKRGKGTNYDLSWKSKGLYTLKLNSLYTAFLHSIKHSEFWMGVKFDKDNLAVKQNNYATKSVNAYIIYNLDASPNNTFNSFKFKIVFLVQLI